jgi:DNA-binding MarR family transcriptional regulator
MRSGRETARALDAASCRFSIISNETNRKRIVMTQEDSAIEAADEKGAGGRTASGTEGGLDLEEFLPYRLSVVTNLVSEAFAQRYETAHGLTVPEWRVMAVLGHSAPLSSLEVGRRTAMDKAKVSRALQRLISSGLVVRRNNPSDNRQNMLALTSKGRATYAQIVPQALELERELTAVLSPDERKVLDRLLARLQERVDAMPDAGPQGKHGIDRNRDLK